MNSQALASVENLLAQMRSVARASQGLTVQPQDASAVRPGGFAAELSRTLDRVSQAQNAANTQAQQFQLGAPGLSLSDVMIDLQKAGLSFQTTVTVRNRLVEAYKEIANMAI
ncbi:flagellar hook-basal body complex protein FliE [Castellaniella hirudinis]|uniref:flagellar hook-basal body complex protein FliE n=1 Tax=Castellaniella hirudinis TaxID=1144617 RepID=UPI0039C4D0CC